jgi:hypothetical protein
MPGIQSLAVSIPLTVGIWVHEGLAQVLGGKPVRKAVESAREGALAALGEGERILVSPTEENRLQRLGSAYSSDVLQWTIRQELALVEGMIRAFDRKVLPVFQEEWEILEVEREGPPLMLGKVEGEPLLWQWRPDGVLLHQTRSE